MERVFVTGIGVVSPLGSGLETFWQALIAGRTGVSALEDENLTKLPAKIGARVADSQLEDFISIRDRRRMSRASQLGLAACEEALTQACFRSLPDTVRSEVAIIIGSSIGGFAASDPAFRDYYTIDRKPSLVIPISMNNGPSANISIRHGLRGPQFSVDAACATSAHSIGMLYNLIRIGQVQIGISGGADSPFAEAVMAAWCSLRVVSTRNDTPATACRPFSADRDGMVLGEGAAILVMESGTSVQKRGVEPLAEIKGYGASSDGAHITQPSQAGVALAMTRALADAGLAAEDIQHINAHATATEWNDRVETAAIKQVFGDYAYRIPVVGTKAALGHSIGASGALELAACIQSLRTQTIPPTINYTRPDPDCDLDYVTEGGRPVAARNVMSNSFAFGGSNASLIVGL